MIRHTLYSRDVKLVARGYRIEPQKGLLNRKSVENVSKLRPAEVFLSLNIIERPAHGFQLDMPALPPKTATSFIDHP